MFEFIKNRLDAFFVIATLNNMIGNLPHINKSLIKRDHIPLFVDYKNPVKRKCLLDAKDMVFKLKLLNILPEFMVLSLIKR